MILNNFNTNSNDYNSQLSVIQATCASKHINENKDYSEKSFNIKHIISKKKILLRKLLRKELPKQNEEISSIRKSYSSLGRKRVMSAKPSISNLRSSCQSIGERKKYLKEQVKKGKIRG
mmetsp:Transcript_10567/g.9315  ORF Transcript_10567/g.9315 Transcript_10567/m.9315 type:complete len:119 (+) Transcript_10567:35-391(+)